MMFFEAKRFPGLEHAVFIDRFDGHPRAKGILARHTCQTPRLRGQRRLPGTLAGRYSTYISGFRARVEKGRLVLDEPTTLPEGTVVELVADDEGDDLSDDERHTLHEALSASWKSAQEGRLRPALAILDELRQRRSLRQMRRSAKATAGHHDR